MKIICALCKKEKENKKNTHYLTDKIIRNCLNQDGDNEREKGLYYDISNINSEVKLGFQRNTNIEKVEQILGRKPIDTEIEDAKHNPYSVDHVFCKDCEKIFASIEAHFIDEILPKFRQQNLNKKNELLLENSKLIRLFFLLQIWRTSICERTFTLSDEANEDLRKLILMSFSADDKELKKYPLAITYLQTLGGDKEYTRNIVGSTCDKKNPKIIFMNDFIIQFYEKKSNINFNSLYGINCVNKYKHYINLEENNFCFQILSDNERKIFLKNKDKDKQQRIAESNLLLEIWKQAGRTRCFFKNRM